MRIAIAGGSGLIGQALVQEALAQRATVYVIGRTRPANLPESVQWMSWSQLENNPPELEGLDGLVNLAGETINQRWTTAAKARIVQSRLDTTRKLVQWTQQCAQPPAVVIQGSAVGIYGFADDRMFTEQVDVTEPTVGGDFLAQVVKRWEDQAQGYHTPRLIVMRTGVVLAAHGGALSKMLLPYKVLVGGRIGSGKQWLSWIHLSDMVRLIMYGLTHKQMHGIIHATAPEPVTNDQFGRVVARQLGRPHWLPLPGLIFRAVLGEMATLLLTGQRVEPQHALEAGFKFHYSKLESAMQDLCRSGRL